MAEKTMGAKKPPILRRRLRYFGKGMDASAQIRRRSLKYNREVAAAELEIHFPPTEELAGAGSRWKVPSMKGTTDASIRTLRENLAETLKSRAKKPRT